MSNASTIRRQVSGTQQLTIAPLLASVISSTPTAFQLNNNALTLSGGGVIPLSAGVTGLYQGTGQVLAVRAAGSYSGATSGTSTIALTLYEIPASLLPIANTLAGAQTFTNWNIICTGGGGAAVAGASGSFQLQAQLQLDAAGNIDGQFSIEMDNVTLVSPAKITQVTGLVGEADLNFALVVTLGGAEPSTEVITLNEFAIDLQ